MELARNIDGFEIPPPVRRVTRTQFGSYRLAGKIAGGGMAEVFQAIGPHGERVALKRIRADKLDDPEHHRMLLDEAKIAHRLQHPNIARVMGVLEEDGELALILEYVDGIDLSRTLEVLRDRDAQLSIDAAIEVLTQVLDGLEFAHRLRDEQGQPLHVVHRDVSPGNVMIDVAGAAKIVDWGIARSERRFSETEHGNVKGKFRYMAPEQITGQAVGPHTDVYAAAVTFWELVAGRRLYDDAAIPVLMMQVARGDVPDLSEAREDVPPALVEVYRRATAVEVLDRYPSARAFREALDGLGLVPDPRASRERLGRLPLAARLLDRRRGYERAVEQAKELSQADLERAVLRALEVPDRIDAAPIDWAQVEPADTLGRRLSSIA